MFLPKKDFESYAKFQEVFAPDLERTAVEVKYHLEKFNATVLGEIYARFDWPKKEKTKGKRVDQLLALWEAWKDSAPESAIAASLLPMEAELSVALLQAKTLAENKLLAVNQMKFESIKTEEDYKLFSGAVSDLKDLSKAPDDIRLEKVKPLTDMVSRLQKSVKAWRAQFDEVIDAKTLVLKSWAKEYVEEKETKSSLYQDAADYYGAIKDDISRIVNAAEKTKLQPSADMAKVAKENFLNEFNLYLEQVRSVLEKDDQGVATGYAKVIEYGADAFDAQVAILSAATLPEAAEGNKKREASIGLMKKETERLATILGAMIDEQLSLAKQAKPKTQLGLRKKLKAYISSLGSMGTKGMTLYDISADIMEDEIVIKAITKVIEKKIKSEGIKPGDDLEEIRKQFGESIVTLWDLV